jgi:hypothetical protein
MLGSDHGAPGDAVTGDLGRQREVGRHVAEHEHAETEHDHRHHRRPGDGHRPQAETRQHSPAEQSTDDAPPGRMQSQRVNSTSVTPGSIGK